MALLKDLLVSGAARLLSTLRVSGNTYIDGTLYLNGAIGSNSNFVFVDTNGQFVTAAETIGTATKPVYINNGIITAGTAYGGGTAVTLNNSSKAGSTASFYAPTSGGTANIQALVSNGNAEPKWVNISPSITITAGTTSAAPKVNVTVLSQSGTAQALTIATAQTTSADGIYGVVKLTKLYNNADDTRAMTGAAVKAAIDTLDFTSIGVAATTGNRFVSQISQTDGKISAVLSTATIGSGTQPIWVDGGTIKATTYSLSASVAAGVQNTLAYYSTATTISDTGEIYANDSSITINGSAAPANSGKFQVIGTSTMQNILPQTTGTYTLGNGTLDWKYLYLNSTDASAGWIVKNSNQSYASVGVTAGTTSAVGWATLILGNNVASGTANNAAGRLQVYHSNTTSSLYTAFAWTSQNGSESYSMLGSTSTTSGTTAYTTLILGNSAAVNTTTAHSEGRLRLYSANTSYHDLKSASTTSVYTHTLPNSTGWVVTGGNGSNTGVAENGKTIMYLETTGVLSTSTESVGTTTQPVYLNSGVLTAGTAYAGGTAVTLNGASKSGSTASFYAPTAAGSSGQLLTSNGSGAPSWTTITIPNTTSFVQKTGDTMSGRLVMDTLAGKINVTYGETLPAGPANGDIFFQLADNTVRELPMGGSTGQVLVKTSSLDFDIAWADANAKQQPGSGKFYVSGSSLATANIEPAIFNTNVYVQSNVLYGAAWNDYAEFRELKDDIKIDDLRGRCVIENGDGTLSPSTERLQGGAEIVSDTFGFAIGETEKCKLPIAVSGRVLAYPFEDIDAFFPGAPVCSGPDGTVSIMTVDEARMYPWKIIGTVSSIPVEKTWGENDVEVNGRIWIRVR